MFLANVRPSTLKSVVPATVLKVLIVKERESALTRLLIFQLAGLGCYRMGDDGQSGF